MGQLIPFKIEHRYKGMSDDVRIQDFDSYFLALHYDIFSDPKRAIPFRDTEDNTTDGSNTVIKRFHYEGSKLYGLGRISSVSNVTKIYEKASNAITDAWTASSSGEDSSGTTDPTMFLEYERFLFMFANGTRVAAYNIDSPAFTATAVDLTAYTNPCQGLVTRDGLLLVPYDNKVAVKDSGSDATSNWETARLTLPSTLRIVDIEEIDSDYVGILCKPVNQDGTTAKFYIWDKVSADVSQSVDLGQYDGEMICNIDGEIYLLVSRGVGSSVHFEATLELRRYSGGELEDPVKQVKFDDTTVSIHTSTTKIRSKNMVEVAIKGTIDGTTYYNMWAIGKKQSGYPVVMTMSYKVNNDSIPTTIDGAYKLGDYYFFAINSGTVIRTNNDDSFDGATTTYISQKINGEQRFEGAARWLKNLSHVSVTAPPLPAGTTITLSYRTDEDTSWTTLFAWTTANEMVKQAATNSDLTDIDNFYEIQFRIQATGGTSSPASWLTIEGELEALESALE